MTSDEKIKWVRDRVYELENLGGLGMMVYPLQPVVQEIGGDLDLADFFSALGGNPSATTPPRPKEKVVVITVDEQKEILKRLESQELLKILEERENDFLLEVFPKHPSPLKLKTIEHIARKLADKFTGSEIVDTLLDYGIPRSDIPYPNTKWRTLQELFLALATSPNPELREKFFGAITTFLHPLNFNADESASHELIEDFNKYLKYDGYEVVAADDGDGYVVVETKDKKKVNPPPQSKPEGKAEKRADENVEASQKKDKDAPQKKTMEEAEDEYYDYSDGVEREIEILRAPKNAESLAVLREAYKTLMAIASSFCVDPTTPSRELNAAYTQLAYSVRHELEETYCGDKTPFSTFRLDIYKDDGFGIPFYDLYSAELTFKRKGRTLHWDEVRPAMNAMLGQIEDLCDTANAPDVISDPKVQKVISEAMVLLSEIAAKRKGADAAGTESTVKMEIVKMPELQVRNLDDAPIVKGKKRVHLPKFKATDWAKITIRFIDEQNVVIIADKKQVPSDYEALGFSDEKRGKPNTAWAFLLGLAKNGGTTQALPKPIPDNIKQQKKQLSDRLKTIFKNDTDPFYDPTDTGAYRVKITLIPPIEEKESRDTLGTREYLEETMTEISDE